MTERKLSFILFWVSVLGGVMMYLIVHYHSAGTLAFDPREYDEEKTEFIFIDENGKEVRVRVLPEAGEEFAHIRLPTSTPSGNLGFSTPSQMKLNESAEVQLILSRRKSVEEISKLLDVPGQQGFETDVNIGQQMTAELNALASDFEIAPSGIIPLSISKTNDANWKWIIKAKTKGKKKLSLIVKISVGLNGKPLPISSVVFTRDIEVMVTPLDVVKDFISDYWQWLCTVIVFPIIGYILNKLRKKPNAPLMRWKSSPKNKR